jgi:CRISPR-associated protein Cst1
VKGGAKLVTLHYTGHPLFDVGLATITAFARKEDPAELTLDDLDKVAGYIETYYTEQPLSSFLTVSLMNSDFTQPAYKDNPERKRAYAHRVARSFGPETPKGEEICVFTGLPAMGLPLSLKAGKDELPPGRAYRQHIPLITGEGIINFSPWGDSGLPVSGEALLCLQFFPMGCRKCAGRLLAIHSDNPEIILEAAREALHENERAISLAKAQGESKLPDAPATAQTLLIDTLLEMDNRRFQKHKRFEPFSVTAYHLTNSGQSSPLNEKSPPLKIYHLPMDIVGFLLMFNHPDYREAWKELVKRGWELPKPSKAVTEGSISPSSERRRNYLYEDILRLPENARSFVRMYLLRIPKRNSTQVDPRSNYNPRKEVDLVSWQLTDLFLRKVMHMEKERIEEIRKLGDRLAAYVKEQNDKRFFLNFYKVQRYDDFRTLLMRANYKYVKAGKAPLITFDPYLTVFEEGYEIMRPDWRFARDLVLICMIEWLHTKRWFDENPDALPDDKEIDTALTESEQ